ncbi:MAG: hypothetical protein K5821_00305 [Nitrobacter sp.]|uniref:hypothetical protein n=1 Tax=Nitrobacter sp. TaxID=29420 RepID=UPI002618D82A|nr:hypothetical protein [Nitrobacter sp.]MCV0384865.1 hypothetical protein [Nitrobacter sp.]
MAPSHTAQNNVISLPRRHGCSPPPEFDAVGRCRTGETRIRDRWFGIPAVEEKIIYQCGDVRWRRFRPPPHPVDPIQAASYIVGPAVWLAAVLVLWWLL